MVKYHGGMTTALGVSTQLATEIMERIDRGEVAPGTQLLEIPLAEELGCSRNTLREAFRILARDGLVDHIPNRGVFVHSFTHEDVADLYAYRLFIEPAVIRQAEHSPHLDDCLLRMEEAYRAACAAVEEQDWHRVGMFNTAFHQALVDIAGVRRLSVDARKVLVLARIGFISTGGGRKTHGPYVEKNRQLLNLMRQRRFSEAESFLRGYLEHSRNNLLELLPADETTATKTYG
ncbi:transcriptional regulator, GntR family [Corynebacterium efficiens YS-314]|nr:transcriptional regulator, GntR family [Corynebacterium efficiens YS-314]